MNFPSLIIRESVDLVISSFQRRGRGRRTVNADRQSSEDGRIQSSRSSERGAAPEGRGIWRALRPRNSLCPMGCWHNRAWSPSKTSGYRLTILGEPPSAAPHAGWCGGRGRKSPAYPIRRGSLWRTAVHSAQREERKADIESERSCRWADCHRYTQKWPGFGRHLRVHCARCS